MAKRKLEKKTFYFIRHAATSHNFVSQADQWRRRDDERLLDPPLDADGKKQAQEASAQLQQLLKEHGETVGAVVSSPLTRTLQTAEFGVLPIVSEGIPCFAVESAREIVGTEIWNDRRPHSVLKAEYPRWSFECTADDRTSFEHATRRGGVRREAARRRVGFSAEDMPGPETVEELMQRCSRFWDFLFNMEADVIVVVSHICSLTFMLRMVEHQAGRKDPSFCFKHCVPKRLELSCVEPMTLAQLENYVSKREIATWTTHAQCADAGHAEDFDRAVDTALVKYLSSMPGRGAQSTLPDFSSIALTSPVRICGRAFTSHEEHDLATMRLQSGDLEPWAQSMESGVYCGWARVDGIGPNPAVAHFSFEDLHVEIYLLRWSSLSEIYPMELRFVACHYLRPEWDMPPAVLAEALQKDMQQALDILGADPPEDTFLAKATVPSPRMAPSQPNMEALLDKDVSPMNEHDTSPTAAKTGLPLRRLNSSPGALCSNSLNFLETVLRRVSSAAVSISVADADAPSCPLIAISSGFVELTGHSRKSAIGRNCNFLREGIPPEEQIVQERERVSAFCQAPYCAEEAKNSISVTMKNMRRDGTSFWNTFLLQKFTIGERMFILGLQKEVANPPKDPDTDPNKAELESLMKLVLFDQRPSNAVVQPSPCIIGGWTIHSVPLRNANADTSFETYMQSLPGNGASVAELPTYWACKLPSPKRVAGEVKKGFGRGAKQLGFPTANLELSDSDLVGMQRGIYAGFASLNGGEPHMAVVSVGFNPCFDDVEKPLLEAYLVHEFESDFYGAELSLTALFYLRPEWKVVDQDGNFSFSFLVALITNDVAVSVAALEFEDPTESGFSQRPAPSLESPDPVDCLCRKVQPMKVSVLLADGSHPSRLLAISEGCHDIHEVEDACIGKPLSEMLGSTDYQYGDLMSCVSKGKRFVCLKHRFVIADRHLEAVFTIRATDPQATAHVNAYPYLSSLRYWLQSMVAVMLCPPLCMA